MSSLLAVLGNFADNLARDSIHRKTGARLFLQTWVSTRRIEEFYEVFSIRALVVDDYEPWLRFTCSKLQEHHELQVVGTVSDGLDAVRRADELNPDLILLDIGLPTLNGIQAARRILNVSSASRIVFVSENRCPHIMKEALSTGALGYVLKSDAGSELLPAIESALEGKHFISSSVQRLVEPLRKSMSPLSNRVDVLPDGLLRNLV